ncbi:helix-turn-helix domain-containing protein [Dyella subtropica]|uniref:helix-turn-helix domain-containing protein n=1 Tax=Dyella subtropica TaxID=2992127 RepID=UPI0022547A23|nr:helix-turn-helix domain-containing protein [Dyella subtropica]
MTFNASLPTEREIKAANLGRRDMAAHLVTRSETQWIWIFDADHQSRDVAVPTSALRLLQQILTEMAAGNAVQVLAVQAELTTQQAAHLLHVSRPYLVKLLENHVLPFHRTGKHRRVYLADVMRFKDERDRLREVKEVSLECQACEMGGLAGC